MNDAKLILRTGAHVTLALNNIINVTIGVAATLAMLIASAPTATTETPTQAVWQAVERQMEGILSCCWSVDAQPDSK